jgi:uncharacterized GH25 family protein
MMKKIFLFVLILPFCFSTPIVNAHRLWLNIDNEQTKVGQPVRIEIGWGHKFPKDEVIEEKFLHHVYAMDSKDVKIPLKQKSPTEFEFVPTAKGIYTILADIHPGFLSKTTEGYKLRSKTGLDNVLYCFRYDIRAKAIVYAGEKAKMTDRATGDILEIIPLIDTRDLKKGKIFPVKVLYDGKPLSSVDVKATYAGFSDQSNTFAVTTKTDERGVAQIKILKKGNWMVNVMYETPYPNTEECDKYRYNICFTFRVR